MSCQRFSSIVKRSYTTIAIWFAKASQSNSTCSGTFQKFPLCPHSWKTSHLPLKTLKDDLWLGSIHRRSFSSVAAFVPPLPPSTNGTPVFPDLDLSSALSKIAEQRYNDPDAVFVVTGATRGIGLQFVKTLTERTKGTIVACCRSQATAHNLKQYQSSLDDKNRIKLIDLDMEDQKSLENASREIMDEFERVDLLLNVAGILGDGGKTTPGPERALNKVDRLWLEKSFATNVIGPVLFTKELLPLLARSKRKIVVGNQATKANGQDQVSVVANFSARVGSISDNQLGGWYSYRMSKAALNQATRTMAIEFKRSNVHVVALHPGTTNTDLSKPFQSNVKDGSLFPVDFTVNQLLKVIDAVNESNSGGFYDWAGKSISF